MQTEQTLKGLADYAAGKYYQDKEFLAHFTKEHLESTIFLAMKKVYELGMEDAKEALKQQTTNANKTN